MTQTQIILEHLKHHGNITTMTAIMQYGITRLSARIFDLEKQGVYTTKERVDYTADDGTKKHYTVYRLADRDT